jgi:hypothetical protein
MMYPEVLTAQHNTAEDVVGECHVANSQMAIDHNMRLSPCTTPSRVAIPLQAMLQSNAARPSTVAMFNQHHQRTPTCVMVKFNCTGPYSQPREKRIVRF